MESKAVTLSKEVNEILSEDFFEGLSEEQLREMASDDEFMDEFEAEMATVEAST